MFLMKRKTWAIVPSILFQLLNRSISISCLRFSILATCTCVTIPWPVSQAGNMYWFYFNHRGPLNHSVLNFRACVTPRVAKSAGLHGAYAFRRNGLFFPFWIHFNTHRESHQIVFSAVPWSSLAINFIALNPIIVANNSCSVVSFLLLLLVRFWCKLLSRMPFLTSPRNNFTYPIYYLSIYFVLRFSPIV